MDGSSPLGEMPPPTGSRRTLTQSIPVIDGQPTRTRRVKRAFDVVASGLLLLLLAPIMLVIAGLIVFTSPGPALLRQKRLGLERRPFVMYKFRSMYIGSSDEVHRQYVTRLLSEERPPTGGEDGLYKIADDPRVTGLGRILRRTSLDELPQLLNVFGGQMSLIGPRPVLPWEEQLFTDKYAARFHVHPGLTGLSQVKGRGTLTMSAALDLDVEYVARQSFRLDALIFIKTVPAVLSGRGAR
jgi:lipopolysaccharide/colanic/teichoic acid biosynthesis glycosyltransferase